MSAVVSTPPSTGSPSRVEPSVSRTRLERVSERSFSLASGSVFESMTTAFTCRPRIPSDELVTHKAMVSLPGCPAARLPVDGCYPPHVPDPLSLASRVVRPAEGSEDRRQLWGVMGQLRCARRLSRNGSCAGSPADVDVRRR